MPALVQSGETGALDDDGDCDMYMPDDFENMTVALHNFYRAHVHPPAANMRKMVAMHIYI
jgi:hypothetical protein